MNFHHWPCEEWKSLQLSLSDCGHVGGALPSAKLAVPLLRPEEEELVLDDRSAQVVPKIIAAQHVLRNAVQIVEVISCVQLVIATEIEHAPMELIGSTSSNDVDNRAHRLAVFGTVAVAQDLKFLDRVNGGVYQNGSIRPDVIIVHAIDRKNVASRAVPVYREIDTGHEPFVLAVEGRLRGHAGHQLRQLHKAAAVERQFTDFIAFDDIAHGA